MQNQYSSSARRLQARLCKTWREICARLESKEKRARNFLAKNFILHCPNCGDYGLLHNTRIEVFHRDFIDGPWQGITIECGLPFADCSTLNPSGRRDDLLIFFYCENRDFHSKDRPLAIWQRKGSTYVDWWRDEP